MKIKVIEKSVNKHTARTIAQTVMHQLKETDNNGNRN